MLSQTRYRVQAVDLDYYKRNIPCQYGCPAHTDARGYVNAIAAGDFERAYYIARQPNPFATACGRICMAPCEPASRRGKVDTPIPIRALKRFVTQRYGVEGEYSFPTAPPGQDNSRTYESQQAIGSQRGEGRVAVVGSGPAGLTCAEYLARKGYSVTVFEALPQPGGMLRVGIPAYRLPKEVLDREIAEIERVGVTIKTGTPVNSVAELQEQGFDAIFVAVGAHLGQRIGAEGEEGVATEAVTFLRQVALGQPVTVGQRVAVVGAGNAAIDAARTALRLGAKEVTILYRRTRQEMPAIEEEVHGAESEGVNLVLLVAPQRMWREGEAIKVELVRMRLGEVDASGRRRPEPVEGSEFVREFDTVIAAVGQAPELPPGFDLPTVRGNTLSVAEDTLATPVPGVFAGGDCVTGPASVIQSIAQGHRAARAVDAFLQGKRARVQSRSWLEPVDPSHFFDLPYLHVERQDPPVHPFTKEGDIEEAYAEEEAVTQARRCLTCHLQTVFDGQKCILCGGCVDVCPTNCLKLVSIDQVYGEGPVSALMEQDTPDGRRPVAAMIKDETRCIRCGLCQRRCPTEAVQLMAFWFEEEVVYD
ncbi:MAG: FAD-dependent oxidoreductase [Dehalococcoidia bacterium]